MLEHLDRASCTGAWQKTARSSFLFPYFFVTAKSIFIRKRNDPVYEDSPLPAGRDLFFEKKEGGVSWFPTFYLRIKVGEG